MLLTLHDSEVIQTKTIDHQPMSLVSIISPSNRSMASTIDCPLCHMQASKLFILVSAFRRFVQLVSYMCLFLLQLHRKYYSGKQNRWCCSRTNSSGKWHGLLPTRSQGAPQKKNRARKICTVIETWIIMLSKIYYVYHIYIRWSSAPEVVHCSLSNQVNLHCGPWLFPKSYFSIYILSKVRANHLWVQPEEDR